jgi:two-component system, cell cycle response regulator
MRKVTSADAMSEDHGLGERISVMICESSQVQLRILSKAVEDSGYQVQTAQSAEDALAILQIIPTDILLTGIEVGVVNGLEACWSLKSNVDTESIYTIVVTASGQERRLEESLDAGADDFIRKPVNMTELRARLRAASRLVRMQKQFRQLAETDALTGAANRRAFMHCLQIKTEQARRHGSVVSVLMLDLDHFKRVNDTHGHATGDRVLIETVRSVQHCLRDRDMLGRLGGEEFAVVLDDTGLTQAGETAERIRRAIEAVRIQADDGVPVPVTASIGVAAVVAQSGLDTPDSLLQAADQALYVAKGSGRNRVAFARPDVGADLRLAAQR